MYARETLGFYHTRLSKMEITKVIFHTSRINELKYFYRKVLELNCENSESGFKIFLPHTEIEFTETNEGAFYHFAINIPENKIEDAVSWLKARVAIIPFEGNDIIDFKNWVAHSVYFKDPAGNIVELIARHRLRNSSGKPFTGADLLSVSEVGLPVDDVGKFYNQIFEAFNIPVFGSAAENFTACGNDDGLFIIVKEKRQWFPNQQTAKKFPIELLIQSNDSRTLKLEQGLYSISSS